MDLLERLNKVRRSGSDWTAVCPAHDDKTPSLSVSQGDDGRWLLKCFAGCDLDHILAATNIEKKDLFPERGVPSRREIAAYDYGTFQVVRYAPKDFRQRRPDGKGGWVWNLKGVKPRVYHADDRTEQPVVVVVEGEKDTDRLWSLDIPATTNSGGALAVTLMGQGPDDQDINVELLADIRAVFDETGKSFVGSTELMNSLVGIEGRPWGDWKRGKPITTRAIADRLKGFAIIPLSNGSVRGYSRDRFEDAWSRYAPLTNGTDCPPAPGPPLLNRQSVKQPMTPGLKRQKQTVKRPKPLTL